MEIRFDDNKSVESVTKIGISKSVYYRIVDDVEGDIGITLSLCTDNSSQKSYTKYIVENPFKGTVQIFNADANKYVRVGTRIYLGTYRKEYNLYLKYTINPESANRMRIITSVFEIDKE